MEKHVESTRPGHSSATFTPSRSKGATTAISSRFRRSVRVSVWGVPSKRVTLRKCLRKHEKYCNLHSIPFSPLSLPFLSNFIYSSSCSNPFSLALSKTILVLFYFSSISSKLSLSHRLPIFFLNQIHLRLSFNPLSINTSLSSTLQVHI